MISTLHHETFKRSNRKQLINSQLPQGIFLLWKKVTRPENLATLFTVSSRNALLLRDHLEISQQNGFIQKAYRTMLNSPSKNVALVVIDFNNSQQDKCI